LELPTDKLIELLQFADSLFPIGAFAHGAGLEYLAQAGTLSNGAELRPLIEALLCGTLGPCDGAVLAAASRLAARADLDGVVALDRALDAMKPARQTRQASRQMGRQTARLAAAMICDPVLQRFAELVGQGRTPGHHASAFGVVAGRKGWPAEAAAAAFLYAGAAALVSAGLRLLPLGQLEGQQILSALKPTIAALADRASRAGVPWSFAPAMEIAAMRHARLDNRLFRS
jgi:urease accessory protein